MIYVDLKIKYTDDGLEANVKAVIGEFCNNEDDNQIFYYFESEEEIKSFMTPGGHDFIVLEYTIL